MNLKRFIKVTPRDSDKYVVILAANKEFYLAQGAKVEQPTEKEVVKFFPQLKQMVAEETTTTEVNKTQQQPKQDESVTESRERKETKRNIKN